MKHRREGWEQCFKDAQRHLRVGHVDGEAGNGSVDSSGVKK